MPVIGPRFWVRGVEPLAVRSAPAAQRRDFWAQVTVWVLEAKDEELRAGLDRDGNPMAALAEITRKRRRSAMGPADPNAPPLTPAYGLSRTRSLFSAQPTAAANGVVCWWTYDSHTGDAWGEILKYHRDGTERLPVRNVFGLAPQSLATVKQRAADWWRVYQAGLAAPPAYDTGWGRATALPGTGPRTAAELVRSETATPGRRQVTIGNHTYTMQGGLGLKLPPRLPPSFGSALPKPVKPPKPRAAPKPQPAYRPIPVAKYKIEAGPGVEEEVRRIFGSSATVEDVAQLSGALHKSKIRITKAWAGNGIEMEIEHPWVKQMHREVLRDYNGKTYIHNTIFKEKNPGQHTGLGAEMIKRQAEAAKKFGVDHAETDAAKGPGWNGYYTWARTGYNKTIEPEIRAKLADPSKWAWRDHKGNTGVLPPESRAPQTIADLMKTPEGRGWWNHHGEYTEGMVFDFKPGSRSLTTLEDYLTETRPVQAGP